MPHSAPRRRRLCAQVLRRGRLRAARTADAPPGLPPQRFYPPKGCTHNHAVAATASRAQRPINKYALKVQAHDLIHETGSRKGTAIPVRGEATLGLKADYRHFEKDCGVSREHCTVRSLEIKIYGAFVLNRRVDLHAIDATPARWRGGVGSSPLDRARTAASSPRNDLVKNCRVHPTHWLISTQVLGSAGLVARDWSRGVAI